MTNNGLSVIEIVKPTQIVSGGYYMARGSLKNANSYQNNLTTYYGTGSNALLTVDTPSAFPEQQWILEKDGIISNKWGDNPSYPVSIESPGPRCIYVEPDMNVDSKVYMIKKNMPIGQPQCTKFIWDTQGRLKINSESKQNSCLKLIPSSNTDNNKNIRSNNSAGKYIVGVNNNCLDNNIDPSEIWSFN